MITPIPEDKWYAIYTRSRFEKKINEALQKSGFHTLLFLTKERRKWNDRIKTILVPLLPNYVFIKTSRTQFNRVYCYPGFVKFVSWDGRPCEIKEKEISLLTGIMNHGYEVQKTAEFKSGDRVRIVRGELQGWEGKVERNNGKSRVVFQLESIHQAISVEVGASNLERI